MGSVSAALPGMGSGSGVVEAYQGRVLGVAAEHVRYAHAARRSHQGHFLAGRLAPVEGAGEIGQSVRVKQGAAQAHIHATRSPILWRPAGNMGRLPRT